MWSNLSELKPPFQPIARVPTPTKMCQTILHSSRMRTAHALTISPSLLCTGGVRGGCAWSRGVPGLGGAWSKGTWSGGGGCLVGGGIPACTEVDPPMNRMTNRCKNITLPQTSFAGGNKSTFSHRNLPRNLN